MNQQRARGGGAGGASGRNRRNRNVKNKNSTEQRSTGGGDADENAANGNGTDERRSSSESAFNSAEENVIVIESSEEEDTEPASVVNASLIVNLSNANVSQVSYLEERADVVKADESSETLVGESPVEEEKPFGDVTGREQVAGASPPAVRVPDVVPVVRLDVPQVSASALSNSSEESNLADSEVEKLMSGSGGGGGGAAFDPACLPGTVTVLKAPNGVTVYLVGTAHFSQQSQLDVVNTIQATNPTLVLLELCSSRRNILSLDEETVLKEVSEMNFQKVRLALSNSGAVQGVLHLLLLSMSAQLTKKLGMAPGGEFRAAMREARKIPGCVVILADRPFNITISRALAALTFFQKVKLAWQFMLHDDEITKEEIEKCKEMDAISMLLKEMTEEFPTITEVFVNERDIFLAHSLYLAATSEAHAASGRDRVIVGVVGMGHASGIARHFGKTTDESVNQLLRIPETPISTIILRKTFKFCWYGLLGYGVYRLGKRVAGTRAVNIDVGKLVSDRVVAVKSLFIKTV